MLKLLLMTGEYADLFGEVIYTRALNTVGVCELRLRDARVPDWINQGAHIAIYDTRVDAVYRLMDYERVGDELYMVYGEDMMHMLRDTILRAPAGTDDAKWDGDAGEFLCDVLQRFKQQVAPADTVGQMQCMVPMAMLPTVDISISYAWASALEAIREAIAAARAAGRAFWVGVGGASLSPSLHWSYDVAVDVWGERRTPIYIPTTERYATRDEITVAIGVGRGVGDARQREYRTTLQARSHRVRWRERRVDARNSSDLSSAVTATLQRSAPNVLLTDPALSSDLYPRDIDLGDAITLRAGSASERLVVTRVRVTHAGARRVEFEFEEF